MTVRTMLKPRLATADAPEDKCPASVARQWMPPDLE